MSRSRAGVAVETETGDGRDDHHGRRWGARGQWDDEACDDDDDDAGDAGGAGPTADAGGGGARDAGGVGGGGASDAGGGGASDAGGGGASGCASDADCAAGSICLAGACRATCPSGTDVECMRVDVAFSRCTRSTSA
ncbi:MAG: hypothetical protein R3A52_08965 [Polyangiales bacterium]